MDGGPTDLRSMVGALELLLAEELEAIDNELNPFKLLSNELDEYSDNDEDLFELPRLLLDRWLTLLSG